jgi:YD repeat-containing protein
MAQLTCDVANCTAVGYTKATRNDNGGFDPPTADTELRNQTVGLAGNTAFISSGSLSVPLAGVAYANRLAQLAQGTSIVGLGYDAAGRRTSVTLPRHFKTGCQRIISSCRRLPLRHLRRR